MQKVYLSAILCIVIFIISDRATAHDVNVHRAITRIAANGSYNFSKFIYSVFPSSGGLDINSPKFSFLGLISGPKGLLIEGSEREDDIYGSDGANNFDFYGLSRSINHFYDPISKSGLTDVPGDMFGIRYGDDSFSWASHRNETNAGIMKNIWTWQNARDYEYAALKSANPSDRNKNYAMMFRAVGQVMHLLEDASQPEHVRNDQHLSFFSEFESALEKYGHDHLAALEPYMTKSSIPCKCLKDLWDTDTLRVTGSKALIDYETGSPLGLAEYTSGNFLGGNSLYKEMYKPGTHWYAFPSIVSGTNYNSTNGLGDIYATRDHDGVNRSHYYIAKTGDGAEVTHHSELMFFGYYSHRHGYESGREITINNDSVLQEYHETLLPKAVSYATGCLDYFFRASITARIYYDADTMALSVEVTNQSANTFDGGAFELYYDDDDGVRKPLRSLSISNHLSPVGTVGAQVRGTFDAPAGTIKSRNCMLVYKGNIFSTRTATDDVDNNIAIAACAVYMPYLPQIASINHFDQGITAKFADVKNQTLHGAAVDITAIDGDQSFNYSFSDPAGISIFAFDLNGPLFYYQQDNPYVDYVGNIFGIVNVYCFDPLQPNQIPGLYWEVYAITDDLIPYGDPYGPAQIVFWGEWYGADDGGYSVSAPISNMFTDSWGTGGTCTWPLTLGTVVTP